MEMAHRERWEAEIAEMRRVLAGFAMREECKWGKPIRFLRGRGSFAGLERWQTDYVPVYAAWAAIVVIVFPPLFGYI